MANENNTKGKGFKVGEFAREVREWSIGMVGSYVIRATKQGFWAGAARFADATFRLKPDGRLFIRLIEQASQPTTSDLEEHEIAIWVDSDNDDTFLLINQNSTIKKVQLT